MGVAVLEMSFALLLLAALTYGRAGGYAFRIRGGLEGAFFLFLLIAALNLIWVPYYHDAERCFLLIVMYAGTFSILLRMNGDRPITLMIAAVRWTAFFQAILALGQAAGGAYQPTGTFNNPNFLAGLLATGAGICLAGALGMDRPPRRDGRTVAMAGVLVILQMAVILAALLWTRSRGGILSVVVVVSALLLYRYGPGALAAIGAVVAGLLVFPNPFRQRIMNLGTVDVYAYSRLDIWKSALFIFKDNPVWGIGLGQYKFFSPRYAFPVEGHWAHFAKVAENPHSEFLMLAAELGILGLLMLAIFMAALLLTARKVMRRRSGAGEYPLWPLLVLAGVIVQAGLDFNLHSPPIVLSSLILLAAFQVRYGDEPGVAGWTVPVKMIRPLIFVLLPLYVVMAVKPAAGFYYFLRAGGGRADLIKEKASLAGWGEGVRGPDYKLLNRAIFWDGDSAPYHSMLGSTAVKIYSDTGDERWLELAFLEIRTAIELNPNNFNYYLHLADLHESLYRRKKRGREGLIESIKEVKSALELSPSKVFIRERLARLLLETGDAEAAAREFEEALKMEPCFLGAGFGLGMSLERLGRMADAVSRYRETIDTAGECRKNVAVTGYERSLIDLDIGLVHNRLDEISPFPAGTTND